jgi:hypothetical protein
MNRRLNPIKRQKQINRRWTQMDADVQGICVGRAHGNAACSPQEPNQENFVGVICVHLRPSAVPKLFAGTHAVLRTTGKQ